MTRVVRLASVAALFAVVGSLSSPATVFAHATLEASTPAANSVLEESPPAIVLDFDDAIEVSVASIDLFDDDGDAISLDSPRRGEDETVVTIDLPELDDGLYAVIWRVTSADGHPIDGSFSFQIGTESVGVSGDELLDRVRANSQSSSFLRWAYGFARFTSVLAAVSLVGIGGWMLTGARIAADRKSTRRSLRGGAVGFLVGSIAAFVLFGAHATAGRISDVFDPSVWRRVAGLDAGRALLLRVVIAAALVALVYQWQRRQQLWWRIASATACVLAVATFPLAGHPSSLHPMALWFAVDFLHLAAVAAWVGGLFMLLTAGRGLLAGAAGERVVRRFSLAAVVSVPIIVMTGVLQTWKLAGGFDDIAATDWGRLLLVKVTLVVILLAVAGVSRWLLLHDGAGSIRRTVVVEAVVGIAVLGLAAGMVGLPPAPVVAAQPFAAQLASRGLIVEVTLGPGIVGSNEVHVVVTPPGGSIVPVLAAAARVSIAEVVPVAPVQLVSEGTNHYSGSVTLPRSGEWTLDIIVEVTAGDTVLLSTTVPIP